LNGGALATSGAGSMGIAALSVGGAGGNGATGGAGGVGGIAGAGGVAGVDGADGAGGAGGNGGVGNAVTLTSSALITTLGDSASGLYGISRGGNGGNGASSETAGGQGGQGGDAGAVWVSNDPVDIFSQSGDIQTHGAGAYGLYVSSQGGSGGSGGSGTIAGAGGAGGAGAAASGLNLGSSIQTWGIDAVALAVVSAGGAGGAGGSGGMGGNGGAAGDVMGENGGGGATIVTPLITPSPSVIVTYGDYANGMSIYSQGGVGGNGGDGLYLGGAGGAGGAAGSATAHNTFLSSIDTFGVSAVGMNVLSIGGTGGAGGACQSMYFGANGAGGAGGAGSTVTVENNGSIHTRGTSSGGIVAVSRGGAGGAGGLHSTADGGYTDAGTYASIGASVTSIVSIVMNSGLANATTLTNIILTTYATWVANGGTLGGSDVTTFLSSVLAALDPDTATTLQTVLLQTGNILAGIPDAGANGGNGGNAGAVNVLNTGSILTEGDYATGIWAISQGGQGGAALYSAASSGGNGGNAGAVTVNNDGSIETLGASAIGILAQSTGGAGAEVMNDRPAGGNGGDAGAVVVNNGMTFDIEAVPQGTVGSTASILTMGDYSYGIMVQSYGGVGSQGGATLDSAGVGGNGGRGGAVTIGNGANGTITTFGYGAAGIWAQSEGGNGGAGGSVIVDETAPGLLLSSTVLFGGAGGFGGAAGDIAIANQGQVVTHGDLAYGIIAESRGGAGAAGGTSLGSLFGGNGGDGGNGGAITIDNDGLVETHGAYAQGIRAISVGGAPGAGGDGTLGAGIAGVGGSVGDVTVNSSGSVLTYGSSAVGIYVSSTPGEGGTAGNLYVNVGSDVVPGVAYPTPVIQGGVGGVGVEFTGGNNNVLNNAGTVLTLDGLLGWAVIGGAGNEQVNNTGLVIGNVDLGAGVNGFDNDGRVESGASVALGTDNVFRNRGSLAPGGSLAFMTTTLTGNYEQSGSGSLEVKLGGTSVDSFDRVLVSGTATLDGTLYVSQANGFVPDVGNTFRVLTSTGRTGEFAGFFDPYYNNYAVYLTTVYDGNDVVLQTVQDSFERLLAPDGLTHNQRSVARGVDSAIGDPRADPVFGALDDIPRPFLPGALDLISPASLGLLLEQGVGAAGLFAGNMQSRMGQLRHGGVGGLSQNVLLFDPNRSLAANEQPASVAATATDATGSQTPVPKVAPPSGWGIFAMGNAQVIDIGDTHEAAGGDIKTAGITLGADAQVCHNLLMGVAFDYVNSDIGINHGGDAEVQGGKGSVFATWFDGNFYLDGAVGGGVNSYDTKRLALGGWATGSTDGYELNGMLGGGYDAHMGAFTLSPGASLYYTMLTIDGFTEKGSIAPLKIETIDSSSLRSRLGATLAYTTKLGSVQVKPELGAYWQHEFLDVNHTLDARLASGAGSTFSVEDAETGRDSLPLALGLNVQWTPRVGMHLRYEQVLLRQNAREFNVMGGLDVGL
jgi:uncharacterized protein YhjY with autotransporter beta-barrel domain